jgi:hypothetical protein
MARGAPRAWGVLLGTPSVGGGVYALLVGTGAPAAIGYPLILFGTAAILIGGYVATVSPEAVDVDPIEEFTPSQLGAYLTGGTSLPFLIATLYLLYGTRVPYVWPTLAFLAFVVLFVKGSVRYWQNTLTTYYVTDDRIVSEYRFLSLKRSSINHDDVTNVSRRQSLTETLTGLGTVEITVAGSGLTLRDLARPAEAERVLNSMSE